MAIKPNQSLHINETEEQDDNSNDSFNDLCELCPICQQQAFGKVVQCGTCGEWFHYECLNIDDSAIDTLGEDDFVCRSCSDGLLYTSGNEHVANPYDQLNTLEIDIHNRSGISTKTNDIQIDSANPDLNRLYTPPGSPNTNCKAIPTPVAGNNTHVIEEGCNNVKSTVNLNACNNDSHITSTDNSEKSKPKYTK